MPPRSVRARTTLVASGVVALVLVLAVAALALAAQRVLADRIHDRAEAQVAAVVDRLRRGVGLEEALAPTRGLLASPVPLQVEILDEEGGALVGPGFFSLPGVEGVTTTGVPWRDPVVRVGDTDLAVAQQAVEVDGRVLLVVAASPLAEVVHSVRAVLNAAAVLVPLVVALVAVVTWTAIGRTMRPIERIRTEVEELSSQTLDRRVPVPDSGDEVARLAETMNGMLARLESAAVRQREFVSDASHELRSPVAAIRTELEVALAHPSAGDWRDVAAGVLSETDRLERIVDGLLQLARLDESAAPRAGVTEVARTAHEAAARLRGVGVTVDVPFDLQVAATEGQLASLLSNLLENAARHAASRVAVAACAVPEGQVVITVDDDGPGIPEADRERVFARFTRLDAARGREDGGVGLGLAVVERLTHHLGGAVTVERSPLGGARFAVILPQAGLATSRTSAVNAAAASTLMTWPTPGSST